MTTNMDLKKRVGFNTNDDSFSRHSIDDTPHGTSGLSNRRHSPPRIQTITRSSSDNNKMNDGSLSREDLKKKKEEEVDDKEVKVELTFDLAYSVSKIRNTTIGRCFSNLYVFSFFVGASFLFTSMVGQVIQVQLTSLERQFDINNAQAGLFNTVSTIGLLSAILFAGHFAKKSHIPMIVGVSGVIQGLVLMIPAFLQLAYPYSLPAIPHSDNSTNSTCEQTKYLCVPHPAKIVNYSNGAVATVDGGGGVEKDGGCVGDGEEGTDSSASTNEVAYAVIMVVQAIKGVTDAFHAVFLPTIYLDDNVVDKTRMGIFLGIQSVMSELATPLGREINGFLTEIPIDLSDTDMDPKDQRFVSAWWLAFLIFGVGTILFSLPITFFPRKILPTRERLKALENAVVNFTSGSLEHKEVYRKLSDDEPLSTSSPINSPRMHGSPTYGTTTPSKHNTVESFDSATKNDIGPDGNRDDQMKIKAMEDEKNIAPATKSNSNKRNQTFLKLVKDFPKAIVRVFKKPTYVMVLIDTIIVSIFNSGIGLFKTAYMSEEYNVPMSEVAYLTGITMAVGSVTGSLLSGWVASRLTSRMGLMYWILGCYFVSVVVAPICLFYGCDNVPVVGALGYSGVYHNASEMCVCTASQQLISCGDDAMNYISPCYAGCTGVDGNVFTACTLLSNTSHGATVTPGLCATPCHDNFLIYVAVHSIENFVISMSSIPRRLLILRLVDHQDRGFGLGLNNFCFFLVAIPAPSLFGSLIDSTCLIWDGSHCTLYDRTDIRYIIAGIDLGVLSSIQVTFMLVLCTFVFEKKRARRKAEFKQQRLEV